MRRRNSVSEIEIRTHDKLLQTKEKRNAPETRLIHCFIQKKRPEETNFISSHCVRLAIYFFMSQTTPSHLSRGGDGPLGSELARALLVVEVDLLLLVIRLLDRLLTLGNDNLDVAGVGHVGVDLQLSLARAPYSLLAMIGVTYASVSAVSPSSLLGSLVDLDVGDDQVGGIETLNIGIGLGVAEESEKELGRLNGPAGTGDTELLS